jgi:hypothetical protein
MVMVFGQILHAWLVCCSFHVMDRVSSSQGAQEDSHWRW